MIGAVVYVDVRPFEDKIGVLMAVGFGSLVVNWRIAVHNGRIIQCPDSPGRRDLVRL